LLSVLTLALVGASAALPAAAELVGGEVGVSYQVLDGLFEEELDGNVTGVRTHGAVDYRLTRDFGVQAGLAFDRLSYDDDGVDLDLDVRTFDLHGYYQIENARLGAFIGRTDLDELSIAGLGSGDLDTQLSFYGAEYEVDSGPATFGARLGRASIDDVSEVDGGFIGLDVAYALNDSVALVGAFDRLGVGIEGESGDEEATAYLRTITAGVEYYVTPSLELSAFVGQSTAGSEDIDFEEDALQYGVGAAYVFGSGTANRNRLLRSLTLPF